MHRAGFPESLFVYVKDQDVRTKHEKAVDRGTGTGSALSGLVIRRSVEPSEQ